MSVPAITAGTTRRIEAIRFVRRGDRRQRSELVVVMCCFLFWDELDSFKMCFNLMNSGVFALRLNRETPWE